MIEKEKIRLGQTVLVGEERRRAVVDSLTQSFAGVIPEGGPYIMADYEDLYWEE